MNINPVIRSFTGSLAAAVVLAGCAGVNGWELFSAANSPAPAQLKTLVAALEKTTLIQNLQHPWGMAWLPSGEMLVTERSGRLQLIDPKNRSQQQVSGVPPVFASGQGGLLDIALHPQFAKNRLVYFTYSAGDRQQNRTQVARATYRDRQLSNWQVIFKNNALKSGTQHFGSRLQWLPDGTLLVAIGDGGNPPLSYQGSLIRTQAQNPNTHLGKIIRIKDDGSIPADNPQLGTGQARPEIWSLGHRNIQGLTFDPLTQKVWATEHGARGGDELNQIAPGKNYGWPLVSFSKEYNVDRPVAPATSQPGYVDPQLVWTPSIAPSGLTLYRSDDRQYPPDRLIPAWHGNLFAGALVNQSIVRIQVNPDGTTQALEEIPIGQRVRDVRQGPDGCLYVLTDSAAGQLIRLAPLRAQK